MILCEAAQGTPEWLRDRLGVLTASRMEPLIDKRSGKFKPNKGAHTLAAKLAGERRLGASFEPEMVQSQWMERGSRMEGEARDWLSFSSGIDFAEVGLALSEEYGSLVGASFDGLSDGPFSEIKCPSAAWHIQYIRDPGVFRTKYAHQVQGGLLVSERPLAYQVSYCPGFGNAKAVVLRVEPDEAYQAELRKGIDWTLKEAQAITEAIKAHDPYAAFGLSEGEAADVAVFA